MRRLVPFITLVALLWPPTFAQALYASAGWGKPRVLAPRGQSSIPGQVRLATTPGGRALLTWSPDSSNFPQGFQYSERPAGGEFGRVRQEDGSPMPLALGIDSAGDAIAAYRWSDGTNDDCCLRLSVKTWTHGGGSFGRERELSRLGSDVSAPTLATSSDGRTAIAWTDRQTAYVVERRHGKFGRPRALGSGNWYIPPRVGYDQAGTLIVAWMTDDALHARFRRSGRAFGHLVTVARARDGYYIPGYTYTHAPPFAVDPSGHAILAWFEQQEKGGGRLRVVRAVRRPGVMRFERARDVRFGPATEWTGRGGTGDVSGYDLDVAVDARGRAVVAWRSCGPSMCGIEYTRRGADRQWTPSHTINNGRGLSVRVAMNERGKSVLLWEQNSSGGGAPSVPSVDSLASIAGPGKGFPAGRRIASGGFPEDLVHINEVGDVIVAAASFEDGVTVQEFHSRR